MPPGGEGSGSEKPLPGAPLAPMPQASSAGALPELNLLFDPRSVRFGTPHYLVLLQHWAQLGRVRQWRQGKAVAFKVDWATVYDPGCQPSYEGLVPQSRAVKAAAVAANVAKPAAQAAPMANAGAPVLPVEAPSLSLPAGHGGSGGKRHQREFRGILLACLH